MHTEARAWAAQRSTPTRLLANTPAPTTPRMKAGPELLQKASSRSASVLVHMPLRYRPMAVVAPTG